MKVHEIMTAHARCVGPDNTLVEAAGLMRELDVGALPICADDRLAGMITDRDIAIRAVADGRDPSVTPVSEIMTPGIAFVFADQPVEEAARMMQEREVRRLAVVNREKRLVGMLSLGDIAMSSTPAFSGITLREVSQPEEPNGRQRRRDSMGRAAGAGEPIDRLRMGNARDGTEDSETPTEGRTARSRATGRKGTTTSARDGAGGGRQKRERKTSGRSRAGASGKRSQRGAKTTSRSRKGAKATARAGR